MKISAIELSLEFSKLLKQELTPEQLNEMKELNKSEPDNNICHSHDFCDANQIMLEAFENILHREPDLNDQADIDLINNAWSIAKK